MKNNLDVDFEKTYPFQRIRRVLPYKGGLKFVVGESKNGELIMDPFYIYNPIKRTFIAYDPTANMEEFEKLLSMV